MNMHSMKTTLRLWNFIFSILLTSSTIVCLMHVAVAPGQPSGHESECSILHTYSLALGALQTLLS